MFRHNGFMRIPKRIPEDEVAALKAAIVQESRAAGGSDKSG
jgi:hypothetical protein